MPLQSTSGAASYDGFGGGAPVVPKYIEEYFSTFLYQGTGASNTINNSIDLATKGGLVWTKSRNLVEDHNLFDTARGVRTTLNSNTTAAQYQADPTYFLTSFNSNGFTMGLGDGNANGYNYTSWSFAKAPKFFDVVTWTGDGTGTRTISHSLGSVPGAITMKALVANGGVNDWPVYHRSTGASNLTFLNLTAAAGGDSSFASTDPTSTKFTVSTFFNVNGNTYVAYLFAHNAGGFGLTGTDNVISCGSFTTDGSGIANVTLGYEPQYLLVKRTNSTSDWFVWDSMRGLTMDVEATLWANLSAAEEALVNFVNPTATGFVTVNGMASSSTYIYIAIRRGPMKVPTDATKVFSPIAASNATNTQNTTGFPVDFQIQKWRTGVLGSYVFDRLRGISSVPSTTSITTGPYLRTSTTSAEISVDNLGYLYDNTSFQTGSGWNVASVAYWNFGRAPNFFDEVCYTGTGSATTINHNLGVAPELMIIKKRSSATNGNWAVYSADRGNTSVIFLNLTNAVATSQTTYWNSTSPTSTVFTVGTNANLNSSSDTFVAYLFATCAGVSKCTAFTGNGSTQTINCGFTSGARFVMIKATSTTGNWLIFDTSRGMTTSTDPWLALNSTAAESATSGACTTTSVGFTVDESKLTGVNTNGVSYIVLAVA